MNVIGCLMLLGAIIAGLIATLFKQVRIVGLATLFLAFAVIAFYVWQGYHYADGFDAVPLGASEHDLVAAMGSPRRTTDGSEIPVPGVKKSADQMTPGCVKEVWYHEFFQPSAFAFCFDDDGHLIQKYNWSSW
jgi:hypothetical protein